MKRLIHQGRTADFAFGIDHADSLCVDTSGYTNNNIVFGSKLQIEQLQMKEREWVCI